MSKIFLASFKGTHPGLAGLVNIGIRKVTQGIYSHSEIVIGDDPFNQPAYCASATGVEGGVRGKMMQLAKADWDLIEIDWISEQTVEDWMTLHDADKYDYIGDVRFLLPLVACQGQGTWFCSEMCAAILGFEEPWRMDPNMLPVAVKNIIRVKGM